MAKRGVAAGAGGEERRRRRISSGIEKQMSRFGFFIRRRFGNWDLLIPLLDAR
jgi:hypothetical protein